VRREKDLTKNTWDRLEKKKKNWVGADFNSGKKETPQWMRKWNCKSGEKGLENKG